MTGAVYQRKPDPTPASIELEAEEEYLRRASLVRRRAAIETIRFHLRRGMSRRTLAGIHGPELVDAVLAGDELVA